MVEICDNAIDDDGDNLIDLNDDDCICTVIEPKSLIPNPSFEEKNCCPENRSQLDCADVWIQASGPTTDYIHNCGYGGWDEFPPPRPFPDGDGILGFRDGRRIQRDGEAEFNWKEYAGACLLSPLEPGTAYRFQFDVGFVDGFVSPAIDITFFGTTDCENLPFGQNDDALGCPTNGPGWIELGARRVSGNSGWINTSIDITPQDRITAIAIGPSCRPTSANVSTYYFFDNLLLDDQRSFEYKITEEGHPCEADFTLDVPYDNIVTYQWYKDNIAIIGETKSSLSKMYGEGNYQLRTIGPSGCNVTKAYDFKIPVLRTPEKIQICKDDTYDLSNRTLTTSGFYQDTLTSVNSCDSIIEISLEVLGELAFNETAKIFEGETYSIESYQFNESGTYDVPLTSRIGCDSLVTLDLDYYHVYFPNVFSPTSNGPNRMFRIIGNDDLIDVEKLIIYDRWGHSVYDNEVADQNDQDSWDGRRNGQYVATGIYTYIAHLRMDDGLLRTFSGTVMVVL